MNRSVFKIWLYIYSENWGHLNYSQIQNESHTKHTQSYIGSLKNNIISFNWLCYLWKLYKGMITISYHILFFSVFLSKPPLSICVKETFYCVHLHELDLKLLLAKMTDEKFKHGIDIRFPGTLMSHQIELNFTVIWIQS